MKSFFLFLFCACAALSGCENSYKGKPYEIGAISDIDYDTLWKVCRDVVKYKSGHAVRLEACDKEKGKIESDWSIHAGHMSQSTFRTRVLIDIVRDKKRAGEFKLSLICEREVNDNDVHPELIEKAKWSERGQLPEMEDHILQNIAHRLERIREARKTGLPDPSFGDFIVGEEDEPRR